MLAGWRWTWQVRELSPLHSSLTLPNANNKGMGRGNTVAMKVDIFALLYIVKKERIMYIEILFWIKNMSMMTGNFARTTKKYILLKRLNKNCLHSKGAEVSLSDPLQNKRPSVALLFCQQLVVCPVNFWKEASTALLQCKSLTGFVWSPNLPIRSAPWPRPSRPYLSQHVLFIYLTQSGMHVKQNTYTVTKKLHNTITLIKKSFTQEDVFTVYNILSM